MIIYYGTRLQSVCQLSCAAAENVKKLTSNGQYRRKDVSSADPSDQASAAVVTSSPATSQPRDSN